MDITKTITKMKQEPGFTENVGMILIHNGVVCGCSRSDHAQVQRIDVSIDRSKIEQLRLKYMEKPGIYRILVEAKEGQLNPGDDLLFIVVAGDIRENVKLVLAELLDRIKSEAVHKTEIKNCGCFY